MKRKGLKVLAGTAAGVALIATLGATTAFGAPGTVSGSRYVDANADGVCDWFGSQAGALASTATGAASTALSQLGSATDGAASTAAATAGARQIAQARACGLCGGAYVDADGDGVCDNCPQDGTRPQDGTGYHHGWTDGSQGGAGNGCGTGAGAHHGRGCRW